MSSVAVLGLLWALVGVPLAVRFFQERRELPMEEFQRAMGALQGPAPTVWSPLQGGPIDTAARRRLISRLTYAPGLLLLAGGLVKGDHSVLAVGLALVNLGTAHRLLALSVDHRRSHQKPLPFSAGGARPLDPGIDQLPGDAQTGGDGWQIIGPEPRRFDDLVLVDADLA